MKNYVLFTIIQLKSWKLSSSRLIFQKFFFATYINIIACSLHQPTKKNVSFHIIFIETESKILSSQKKLREMNWIWIFRNNNFITTKKHGEIYLSPEGYTISKNQNFTVPRKHQLWINRNRIDSLKNETWRIYIYPINKTRKMANYLLFIWMKKLFRALNVCLTQAINCNYSWCMQKWTVVTFVACMN